MKRVLCIILCLAAMLICAGCNPSDNSVSLSSGWYLAEGDYEQLKAPYLSLNTAESTFTIGQSLLSSYLEKGLYSISDGKITAISENTTFVFEIADSDTLVLIDNGGTEKMELPVDTKFVYDEDFK